MVVSYIRNADKTRDVVSAIESGGRALAVRAHMSQIAWSAAFSGRA